MSLLKRMKALARTRSLAFTEDYVAPPAVDGEASVRWWSGDGRPVYYRRGTSDAGAAYDILFKQGRKSEYWLPAELAPRLILDIGGNIGMAARYLANLFPGATIHSFEPIPDNYRMLQRNAAGLPITAHPYGLGRASATLEFRVSAAQSTNRGFYSMTRAATEGDTVVKAEVRAVDQVLAALGSPRVDLIKIDVEGAEEEIISAMPDELLAGTKWVYGELHAEQLRPGLAFAVLERLARWFDIEVHKPLRKRNWFFDACNKSVSDQFRSFRRRR